MRKTSGGRSAMRWMTCAVLVFGLSAAGGSPARANGLVRLFVPGNHATIQAALDAAPRDRCVEIFIQPGVHRGPISVTGFTDLALFGEPSSRIESDGEEETAVTVADCVRLQLAGLTISSRGAGIHLVGAPSAIARGLTITAGDGPGILAEGSQIVPANDGLGERLVRRPTSVRVEDCVIESAAADAIRSLDAGLEVASCRLSAGNGDGIHAGGFGGALDVRSTIILDAGDDGIEAVTVRTTVEQTAVLRCGDDGVRLSANGFATLGGVIVHDAGGDGIDASRTATAVTGCVVLRCGGDGIRTSSVMVTDNVVEDAGRRGIAIEDALAQGMGAAGVAGNRVTRTTDTGIVVTINGARIGDNVVTGAGSTGIRAEARDVLVEQNSVDGAGSDGIEVTGSNARVIRNIVTQPRGDGIVVEGDDADVSENFAASTRGAGIRMESLGGVLRGNATSDTGSDGVVVGAGYASVTGQDVRDAGRDGIRFTGEALGERAPVQDNTVRDCDGDGIDLGPAFYAFVERNVVEDASCGFRIGDGAQGNRLSRNKARRSRDHDLWEGDGPGRNRIARSNRFRTVHRRAR